MKTVIVFDTEDSKGMAATYKIVDHLSMQYLQKRLSQSHEAHFGKITFIKMLREYGNLIQDGKMTTGLRDTKEFADKVFLDQGDAKFKHNV